MRAQGIQGVERAAPGRRYVAAPTRVQTAALRSSRRRAVAGRGTRFPATALNESPETPEPPRRAQRVVRRHAPQPAPESARDIEVATEPEDVDFPSAKIAAMTIYVVAHIECEFCCTSL